MREIYCKTGKIKTSLPDKAWDEDSGAVSIPVCEGCQHNKHMEHLKKLKSKKQKDPVQEISRHSVAVMIKTLHGIPYQPEVFCSCDCKIIEPSN